jgi:hypothetical protein
MPKKPNAEVLEHLLGQQRNGNENFGLIVSD